MSYTLSIKRYGGNKENLHCIYLPFDMDIATICDEPDTLFRWYGISSVLYTDSFIYLFASYFRKYSKLFSNCIDCAQSCSDFESGS